MQTITVTMTHSPESIRRLAKVQYTTFHPKAKAFWYTAFSACILAGIGLFGQLSTPVQIGFLAVGGIGIMNVGASSRAMAEQTLKTIKARGNHFPTTQMTFSSKKITVLEEEAPQAQPLDKRKILRLVEDVAYYYIFISQHAAYMLPKEHISDLNAFAHILEQATGQSLHRPLGWRDVTLRWITATFKK